jgi:hypothetical protein
VHHDRVALKESRSASWAIRGSLEKSGGPGGKRKVALRRLRRAQRLLLGHLIKHGPAARASDLERSQEYQLVRRDFIAARRAGQR